MIKKLFVLDSQTPNSTNAQRPSATFPNAIHQVLSQTSCYSVYPTLETSFHQTLSREVRGLEKWTGCYEE